MAPPKSNDDHSTGNQNNSKQKDDGKKPQANKKDDNGFSPTPNKDDNNKDGGQNNNGNNGQNNNGNNGQNNDWQKKDDGQKNNGNNGQNNNGNNGQNNDWQKKDDGQKNNGNNGQNNDWQKKDDGQKNNGNNGQNNDWQKKDDGQKNDGNNSQNNNGNNGQNNNGNNGQNNDWQKNNDNNNGQNKNDDKNNNNNDKNKDDKNKDDKKKDDKGKDKNGSSGNDNNSSPSPPAKKTNFSPPPPSLGDMMDSPPRITSSDSPPGDDGMDDNTKALIVGVSVGSIMLLVLLILCLFACCRKRKRDKDHGHMNYYMDSISGNEYYTDSGQHTVTIPPPGRQYSCDSWIESAAPPPLPPGLADLGASQKFSALSVPFTDGSFSYDELSTATGAFSKSNLLGQGGFGFMHKGLLANGKEVAVKSLKSSAGQGDKEFQAEVDYISRIHHRHLVSLVGCCKADTQRMLVYEFLPNGSLEDQLYGKKQSAMNFAIRLKIALGSAKGLAYLHEDCHPPIIHRDIKAANIILDSSYEAKVTDFGLAKVSDNFTLVSTRTMGSLGYLAPEYKASKDLTVKSDVYAYGIVLLELITGKRPKELSESDRDFLVQKAVTEGGGYEALVDKRLGDKYDRKEMLRMLTCAAACVRPTPTQRPKMSQVVRALESEAGLKGLKSEEDVFGLGIH